MPVRNTETVHNQSPLSETPSENLFAAAEASLSNLSIAGHIVYRRTDGRMQSVGHTTVSGAVGAPAEDIDGLMLGVSANTLTEGVLPSVVGTEHVSADKRLGVRVARLRETYQQVLGYIDLENAQADTSVSSESELRAYPVC